MKFIRRKQFFYNFLRSKKVRDIFSRFEEKLSQQPDQVEDEDEKTRQINDLHRAIEALPERQAKVFTLFFYEKMSQKEIDIATETVYTLRCPILKYLEHLYPCVGYG